MNGYFSYKQKTIQRTLIIPSVYYLTTDNRVIEVTVVGDNPPAFDDVFDLGPVMRHAYDFEIEAMHRKKDKDLIDKLELGRIE